MKVEKFGSVDAAMLFISWDDIFLRFGRLQRLRLVVMKGQEWVKKCRENFEDRAKSARARGVGENLLEIEVMEVERR